MNRRPDSKRAFLAPAVVVVALLAASPAANAAPTAQDEYTLDLPGYGDDVSNTVIGRPDVDTTESQRGVAGEMEEPSSPLGSAFSMLDDGKVLLIAAVFLALALASVSGIRDRLRPPTPS